MAKTGRITAHRPLSTTRACRFQVRSYIILFSEHPDATYRTYRRFYWRLCYRLRANCWNRQAVQFAKVQAEIEAQP
jgi:hypothetical protein